jgi:hypothetical protein
VSSPGAGPHRLRPRLPGMRARAAPHTLGRTRANRARQGKGERPEEQVNLALDLGVLSNPPSLAACGWRRMTISRRGDRIWLVSQKVESLGHTNPERHGGDPDALFQLSSPRWRGLSVYLFVGKQQLVILSLTIGSWPWCSLIFTGWQSRLQVVIR